jgi:predicted RNA-binding Zn-ribbon protein involved in translation (DUF1610 family)
MFKLDIRLERLHEAAPAPVSAPEPRMPQPMLVPAPSSEAAPAFAMEEITIIGAQPCLSCGSRNVHRSKARNLYERFKKLHTATRLYRCHDCGWRGWLVPSSDIHPVQGLTDPRGAVDLASLDSAVKAETKSSRPAFSPRDLG